MSKLSAKFFIRNLLITIVLVSSLIFSCFYYYSKISDEIYTEASERVVNETGYCASLLQANLENNLAEVVSCAYSLSMSKANKEQALAYLTFFTDKNKYLRFSYFDTDGNLTGTDGITNNVAGLPILEKTLQGLPAISTPTLDSSNKTEIVAFSAPVPLDGKPSYGIVGSLHLYTIYDKLSQSFYDGKGYSYVTDSKGEVLIHPIHKDYNNNYNNLFNRISGESGDSEELSNVVRDFSNGRSGMISYALNGETKMISYAPIKGINDWYMICVIPNYSMHITGRDVVSYPLIIFSLISILIAVVFMLIIRHEEVNRTAMEALAFNDKLTGVSNLDKLKLDMTKTLPKKKGGSCALVKFDIDNFKLINDIFGFEAGDKVLLCIAGLIKVSMKEDELFARVSNDDFIMLLKFIDEKNVAERIKQLEESYKKCIEQLLDNYKISFSTGVYKMAFSDDIAVAIEKVTMAHKHAKFAQDSVLVVYDDNMRESALRDKEIENTMQSALDNGEFVVYIQPKYGLIGEHIEGGEALVRWAHPEKGLIPPMEFIPLFEQNGFIVQLDLFVLERVCKLQRDLLDNGKRTVPISVNQSKMLIIQPDYTKKLMSLVAKYNIPTNLIEVELTETTIHDNIKLLLDISSKLIDEGIAISIDDFGSGYSSLNLLKDIPANVLKIDREFLNTSEHNERGQVVLGNIIRLAKDLNMVVVTEGVETIEQIDMLKILGCQMVQGYYYAKPQPIADFSDQMTQ